VSRAADSIGFLLPDFTDGDKFDESDNTFLPVETMISWPVTSAAWSGDVRVTLGSRDGRTEWATQAVAATHTFSALSYATGRLGVTAGVGPGTVYMEDCPPGTLFSGWLANSTGAPINVTVSGLADTVGAIAVADAARLYWHAVSIAYTTEPVWLIVNIFVL
jgi:hypothetical protein